MVFWKYLVKMSFMSVLLFVLARCFPASSKCSNSSSSVVNHQMMSLHNNYSTSTALLLHAPIIHVPPTSFIKVRQGSALTHGSMKISFLNSLDPVAAENPAKMINNLKVLLSLTWRRDDSALVALYHNNVQLTWLFPVFCCVCKSYSLTNDLWLDKIATV